MLLNGVSLAKISFPVLFAAGCWVIPPKISGVHKWNFLGKISEEIYYEEWTI